MCPKGLEAEDMHQIATIQDKHVTLSVPEKELL
jgi:hypothetical protein